MKYYRCIKDLIMNNGIRAFTEGKNYGLEGEIKFSGLTVILNDWNECHALNEETMAELFEEREIKTGEEPNGAS